MNTTKKHTRLWQTVKRLIQENYALIAERSIRGVKTSKGMRASYYIVGDLLYPLVTEGQLLMAGQITVEDYNWFLSPQGYATYRDDVWTEMEQKHGLTRPEAKALGIVYDKGVEYTVSQLKYIVDKARGFIFVEKVGDAEAIQELSEYGWVIVAGQGYPTRLVRKLLKNDTRPVLVLHDWDHDGKGIYRALGFKTKRTAHLDIALGDRVTDLGLTEQDVKSLDLPTRASAAKYGGEMRAELSALEVLSLPSRMGLENPTLTYVASKMAAMNIMLSEQEISKEKLLPRHLNWMLTDGLSKVVTEVVEAFMEELKESEEAELIEGEAVTGVLEKIDIISPKIREALHDTAENTLKSLKWISEEEKHEEALEMFADDKVIELLKRE